MQVGSGNSQCSHLWLVKRLTKKTDPFVVMFFKVFLVKFRIYARYLNGVLLERK